MLDVTTARKTRKVVKSPLSSIRGSSWNDSGNFSSQFIIFIFDESLRKRIGVMPDFHFVFMCFTLFLYYRSNQKECTVETTIEERIMKHLILTVVGFIHFLHINSYSL